jgi:hypothetical protein
MQRLELEGRFYPLLPSQSNSLLSSFDSKAAVSAGKARLLEQYDKREAEVREAMQAAARASVELERATRYVETRTSMDDIWIFVYCIYCIYTL